MKPLHIKMLNQILSVVSLSGVCIIYCVFVCHWRLNVPPLPPYKAVGSVLYGERLGLMLDYIDPEAQHFIDCITLMFKTTSPMLYIPPSLLRTVGSRVWRDHVQAWDGIFSQGRTALLWVAPFIALAIRITAAVVVFWTKGSPIEWGLGSNVSSVPVGICGQEA